MTLKSSPRLIVITTSLVILSSFLGFLWYINPFRARAIGLGEVNSLTGLKFPPSTQVIKAQLGRAALDRCVLAKLSLTPAEYTYFLKNTRFTNEPEQEPVHLGFYNQSSGVKEYGYSFSATKNYFVCMVESRSKSTSNIIIDDSNSKQKTLYVWSLLTD